jgi:hypothetical protein
VSSSLSASAVANPRLPPNPRTRPARPLHPPPSPQRPRSPLNLRLRLNPRNRLNRRVPTPRTATISIPPKQRQNHTGLRARLRKHPMNLRTESRPATVLPRHHRRHHRRHRPISNSNSSSSHHPLRSTSPLRPPHRRQGLFLLPSEMVTINPPLPLLPPKPIATSFASSTPQIARKPRIPNHRPSVRMRARPGSFPTALPKSAFPLITAWANSKSPSSM